MTPAKRIYNEDDFVMSDAAIQDQALQAKLKEIRTAIRDICEAGYNPRDVVSAVHAELGVATGGFILRHQRNFIKE